MEVVREIEIASRSTADRNDEALIKELLDVISSIVADEYIQVAKENQEVFKK